MNFLGTRQFVIYGLEYVRGRTLDLGAGTAKYKAIIQQKASEYIAFDLFPNESIDVVGDLVNTGFPDASFDTIFCTQVFEHIPQPWLAVKEINRILKPGGVCLITAPFMQAHHADPYDYFRYTVQGMTSLFSDFKIIESGYYGKTFFVLFDLIKLLWLNPYKPKKWHGLIVKKMSTLGHFLDRFTRNKIIYGNTYVIVKKN